MLLRLVLLGLLLVTACAAPPPVPTATPVPPTATATPTATPTSTPTATPEPTATPTPIPTATPTPNLIVDALAYAAAAAAYGTVAQSDVAMAAFASEQAGRAQLRYGVSNVLGVIETAGVLLGKASVSVLDAAGAHEAAAQSFQAAVAMNSITSRAYEKAATSNGEAASVYLATLTLIPMVRNALQELEVAFSSYASLYSGPFQENPDAERAATVFFSAKDAVAKQANALLDFANSSADIVARAVVDNEAAAILQTGSG